MWLSNFHILSIVVPWQQTELHQWHTVVTLTCLSCSPHSSPCLPEQTFPTANDFGGEIIPAAAKDLNVVAYPFYGYWEDIGTIKSFFDENLKLCRQVRVWRPVHFVWYWLGCLGLRGCFCCEAG